MRASRRALRRALRHWSCGHRRWKKEKNGKMWREERREEGRGRGKEMAAEAGRWRRGGSDGAKDGLGRAGRIQGRSRILVSGACQVKPAHRLCPPHLTCPCTHVSLARNTLRAKDERTDGAVPSGGGICWLPGQGQGLSRREIRRARLGHDRTEYTDAKQLSCRGPVMCTTATAYSRQRSRLMTFVAPFAAHSATSRGPMCRPRLPPNPRLESKNCQPHYYCFSSPTPLTTHPPLPCLPVGEGEAGALLAAGGGCM